MPLYLNSTKVGSNAYDVHSGVSTKLNKMKMGNTDVWQGLPPYYNELKNGTVLTESQWLEFLDGGGIAKVIQLNDQANFRNKQVQVENSQTSSRKNWIIADFDHDNTINTCDLIQCNTVKNSAFNTGTYLKNYYSASDIKTWLEGTYYNSFSSSVKNKMVTMDIASNNNTLSSKVKILSATEVGASGSAILVEGNKYPIFADTTGTGKDSNRVRTGTSSSWYLRSRYVGHDSVWYVYTNGSVAESSVDNSFGIVPCIRFS